MNIHFIHSFRVAKDTGKYSYQECVQCGKRKILKKFIGGHQPIDHAWLNQRN